MKSLIINPILCVFLFSILLEPSIAYCKVQPSFSNSYCSWNATDIIVARSDDKFDGNIEVLEIWKGRLKKGDRIIIPDLKEFSAEKERDVVKNIDPAVEKIRNKTILRVTGDRMVLYLNKSKSDANTWVPIEPDGIRYSMAWVELKDVYAFGQQFNPGRSSLHFLGVKEAELKKELDEVVSTKLSVTKSLEEDSLNKQLDVILPFLLNQENAGFIHSAILDSVARKGRKGLAVLKEILKNDKLSDLHGSAISVMPFLGPDVASSALRNVIDDEIVFWKEAAPNLKKGWWKSKGIKVEELRQRCDRLSQAMYALDTIDKFDAFECLESLNRLRKFWMSQPQLCDDASFILKQCDKLMDHLTSP